MFNGVSQVPTHLPLLPPPSLSKFFLQGFLLDKQGGAVEGNALARRRDGGSVAKGRNLTAAAFSLAAVGMYRKGAMCRRSRAHTAISCASEPQADAEPSSPKDRIGLAVRFNMENLACLAF